ncbi:MAG: hypothetical protein HYZ57_01380, partial [Acidobacteria bacterium]|nr:hypothetical protein [Acidobacteriota bacterium]
MTCYSPSRHYLSAGLVALAFAALSGWIAAIQWAPAYIAAVLFVASAAILLILALQPPIQISDHHLTIGKRAIVWSDIERVDRTSWISPLVVYLTLAEGKRVLLVYSGDVEGGKSLLRQ